MHAMASIGRRPAAGEWIDGFHCVEQRRRRLLEGGQARRGGAARPLEVLARC